jgi:bifunctional N-acetylglucosamine-1-phosphate-uridyltransferase/glucosamine-1-phosphate-acetyltransferase GlmU-like protein
MNRLLIVPAAGRGSRLGADLPKALVPVAGRPMLDHLIAIHGSTVDRMVLVVAPAAYDAFAVFAAAREFPIDLTVQASPTGMLDAVLAAGPLVTSRQPARVVVTWCDQIGITAATVGRLDERARGADAAALVFPTLWVDRPYIHFDRDAAGAITGVRQRREGDLMPEHGEADMGLFDLDLDVYLADLPRFARETSASPRTGERNFLPFIPWLASRRKVETIAGDSPIEVVGINTPDELAAVESHLAARGPRAT